MNVGVAGFTGEGKSAFILALAFEYVKIAKMPFTMDHFTWSREELLKWINGKGKDQAGQLPEYSILLPDELIFLFYKRRWFDEEQIEGIETFNTCRDRHLLVAGGVPCFWSLDSAFTSRVRYYCYVPERGKVWVFCQENNPFVQNAWNPNLNMKWFRKQGNPYGLPNFVCELSFPDFTPEQKRAYYAVRNRKRITAIGEGGEKRERFVELKVQRDKAWRWIMKHHGKKRGKSRGKGEGFSVSEFCDEFAMGLSETAVRTILER